MPLLELPGLVDAHVHLRDPGGIHKEDWYTGTCAALRGGVVAVFDMPNNSPAVTDLASLSEKRGQAACKAVCDYGLFAGASTANVPTAGGLPGTVGLKMYLSETYGPLRLQGLPILMQHFKAWPRGRPIAIHAEGRMQLTAIALGRFYGKHVHICHVARRADIARIRWAKQRGWNVTCEVTPHHLFLTDADHIRLGPFAYMKPTLGNADDQQALWDNLAVIDLVATDHAPHTLAEKQSPQPPPGVPGLETMLPLLLTAVHEKRLSWERLVELTSTGPRHIYGIASPSECWTVVDTDARSEWSARGSFSKCGWTPYEGRIMQGTVVRTVIRGRLAYEDGRVLVNPGFGRSISLI